ncbi:hypothetical protein [Azospirillum sp. BE72]|uniref:hypothetical protein n=1 Tax=Azospirillum sp. BE72 TaxID=2817776 RepID=UPI0028597146|nr:hypothetical protein [Azospirillum sp. BE72]MDR6772173.1 hypothetical protein [Azospirillum sp. BE72]
MTVLFIAIALSILSIALLVGFDLCIHLPSEFTGAKTIPCNGGRLGEDIMG